MYINFKLIISSAVRVYWPKSLVYFNLLITKYNTKFFLLILYLKNLFKWFFLSYLMTVS